MSLPDEILSDKYELIGKISEGGMGAIYKVRHKLLDTVRVIKVIRAQYADDEDLRERFYREAQASIQLRYPKIAELFDLVVGDNGDAYMEMEFIDGRTIEKLLDSGPPPLPLALEIALQSLDALGFLHKKGYVHRDISPDNIMLTRDHDGLPLVKLIDLGIAKQLEGEMGRRLTATGMFMGKALYTSPEQSTGQGVDARSDLYSFGVMLYELLTGEIPFQGKTLSELLAAHLYHPPRDFDETDPRGAVPEDLRRLVLRCLEKGPDDRIATAGEIAAFIAPIQDRLAGVELDETLKVSSHDVLESANKTEKGAPLPFSVITRRQDVRQMARRDRAASTARDLLKEMDGTNAARPRERALNDRVVELLANARRLRSEDHFDEALEQLHVALALDSRNPEIRALLDETEAAQQADEEQRAQDREVFALAREIETLIAGWKLTHASRKLEAARQQHSDSILLVQLDERLQTAHNEAKILSLLDDAWSHLQANDPDSALGLVIEAQALDPKHRLARELRREAEKHLRVTALVANATHRLDEGNAEAAMTDLQAVLRLDPGRQEVPSLLERAEPQARRTALKRERGEAAQEVEQLLAEGKIVAAHQRLSQARMTYGAVPALVQLDRKIRKAARLRELFEQIRDLGARRKFKSARELMKVAREIDPKNEELRQLRRELQIAWRKKKLYDAAAQIELCLSKGNLKLAGKRLQAAEKEFGDQMPTLRRLREEYETKLEQQQRKSDSSWIRFRR